MTTDTNTLELSITREFDVTPEQLFACWRDPKRLAQWFAPRPWTITDCEIDLRAGGTCKTTMRSPEGQSFPNAGVFLAVEPNRRIVMTDAFSEAWVPSAKPFFVAEMTFEALANGKTRYTATARHWTAEDWKAHKEMGFEQGWGQCAEQMAEVAAKG